MFKREKFIVWKWNSGTLPEGTRLVVLTPDLSDAFDLAERIFLERGYELRVARGAHFDHPMRIGIPGASVGSTSTRQEITDFLSGLNKPWGTWDFRSIRPLEFEDADLRHPLYLAYLQRIEKSMRRRSWLEDNLSI
jgi:hypothetical protein